MRYIGSIVRNQGYYNFVVNEYIDERGKINTASETQVLDDVRTCHPDWDCSQIEYAKQIAIWVAYNAGGNEALDELSDGRKTIWNLDLDQNIELRRDNKGFTTVNDYTAEDDFEEIGSVFPVRREDFETVADALNEKLRNAKTIIQEWIAEQEREYGVDSLADLTGEDLTDFINKANGLFPDFNNNNYGEIYGDAARTAAYLLKYVFAYTYLYKCLYRDIIGLMDEDEEIDVLSIGCGSKIDMAGLKLALLDTDRESAAYYGIDLKDWTNINGLNYCLFPDQGCFNAVDIIVFLRRENNPYNSIKSNIILFPYSMSELVEAGEPWNVVLDELPNRLMSDRVYIAANIRSGENETPDSEAFSRLIEAMENAGYILQDLIEVRGINTERKIYKLREDGSMLAQALNIGTTRAGVETIAGYLSSIKSIDKRIKCNAITGTEYIRYNIAKFIKEDE